MTTAPIVTEQYQTVPHLTPAHLTQPIRPFLAPPSLAIPYHTVSHQAPSHRTKPGLARS